MGLPVSVTRCSHGVTMGMTEQTSSFSKGCCLVHTALLCSRRLHGVKTSYPGCIAGNCFVDVSGVGFFHRLQNVYTYMKNMCNAVSMHIYI